MMKFLGVVFVLLLCLPTGTYSNPAPPQNAGDVKVNGALKPDKVKRGAVSRATITISIPQGLHVQSSKPLDKFLVATKLDLETPQGMRLGPISYPPGQMRKLKFSKNPVSVYEGETAIRVNVSVPPTYKGSSAEIRGNLRFQACNDDSCFPPVTREVKLWLNVE